MNWQTDKWDYMRNRNRALMPLAEEPLKQTTDWPYWLIMLSAAAYFGWQLFIR